MLRCRRSAAVAVAVAVAAFRLSTSYSHRSWGSEVCVCRCICIHVIDSGDLKVELRVLKAYKSLQTAGLFQENEGSIVHMRRRFLTEQFQFFQQQDPCTCLSNSLLSSRGKDPTNLNDLGCCYGTSFKLPYWGSPIVFYIYPLW